MEQISRRLDSFDKKAEAIQRSTMAQKVVKRLKLRKKLPFGKGKTTEETLLEIEDFFEDSQNWTFLTVYVLEDLTFRWESHDTIGKILRRLLHDNFIKAVVWPNESKKGNHPVVPEVMVAFVESLLMTLLAEANVNEAWRDIEVSLRRFFTNVRATRKRQHLAVSSSSDSD